MAVQFSFKRYEKKFILTPQEAEKLRTLTGNRLCPDRYGLHTICNIYYDTDDFLLIRQSIEKPVYKEKFRLRSYGVPGEKDMIFAEIKKKYKGVVYKRRVEAVPEEMARFLHEGTPLDQDQQIQRELQWFLCQYAPTPKVFLAYDREAMWSPVEQEFRVTFDRNIRWRGERLDLRAGDDGKLVVPEDTIIMEVKTPTAIPLWFAHILSDMRVHPASFSKYGACYIRQILPTLSGGYQHDGQHF